MRIKKEWWHEHALELYAAGKGTKEILDTVFGNNEDRPAYEKMRGFLRRHGKRPKRKAQPKKDNTHVMFEQNMQNGTATSERLIQILTTQEKDERFLLQAHGFDPDVWQVITVRNNMWGDPNEDGVVNCQSRVSVKLRECPELTLDDIDNYFQNKTYNISLPKRRNFPAPTGDLELEVCLPDLHYGLFAWRHETGADYDLHIASQHLNNAMSDIYAKLDALDGTAGQASKITLVTLGDILHFDNMEQRTTKGTYQQADGRISKVHDMLIDDLVNIIWGLSQYADVDVVYLPGNHDTITGRMAMKAASMAFRNSQGVTFDLLPNPLKYRMFGKNLVGFTHGDMPQANMAKWLSVIGKSEVSDSISMEVHAGHFHSQRTKERAVTVKNYDAVFEDSGVTVRYLPTLCAASGWEHGQGYTKTLRALVSFMWHKDSGLQEMWFSK